MHSPSELAGESFPPRHRRGVSRLLQCASCGLTRCSWRVQPEDPCALCIDLHRPDCSNDDGGSDASLCAHATIKFKEGDHVTLWIAVLDWVLDAKVRL